MEPREIAMPAPEAITRWRETIRELDTVLAGVSADRDLAFYRAYEAGAEPAEIARWVCADVASVDRTIATLARETDIDQWGEPGSWVCLDRPL